MSGEADWRDFKIICEVWKVSWTRLKSFFIKLFLSGNISVEDSPLKVIYVYFGTETYDEYERDVKVSN